MEVQGFADGRFGTVRQCFAKILAAQQGTGPVGYIHGGTAAVTES